MAKKIIFASGGTGGHIFPAINLMKHFSEKGYDVILVTDYKGNSFISIILNLNLILFQQILPRIKIL